MTTLTKDDLKSILVAVDFFKSQTDNDAVYSRSVDLANKIKEIIDQPEDISYLPDLTDPDINMDPDLTDR